MSFFILYQNGVNIELDVHLLLIKTNASYWINFIKVVTGLVAFYAFFIKLKYFCDWKNFVNLTKQKTLFYFFRYS